MTVQVNIVQHAKRRFHGSVWPRPCVGGRPWGCLCHYLTVYRLFDYQSVCLIVYLPVYQISSCSPELLTTHLCVFRKECTIGTTKSGFHRLHAVWFRAEAGPFWWLEKKIRSKALKEKQMESHYYTPHKSFQADSSTAENLEPQCQCAIGHSPRSFPPFTPSPALPSGCLLNFALARPTGRPAGPLVLSW